MGKPTGIELRLSGDAVVLGVTRSSRAEDSIYEAVEDAIAASLTPTQFIRIAREAWEYNRKEQAKGEDSEFATALDSSRAGR